MKRILSFVVLSLFFAACKNIHNNAEGPLLLTFENHPLSSLFSDKIFGKIEMTPLETTDDCLVGAWPQLLLDGHYFFVYDPHQQVILRFDKSGSFMNRIGQRGRGPGEYSYINDFHIDPLSNLVELLESGGQIMRYHYNGAFLSSQHYDVNSYSFIKTGSAYWFNLGIRALSEEGRLVKISEDGTVIEHFLPVRTDWRIPFTDWNFTQCGERISFKDPLDHTVYRITDEGPVETAVIDFGKYAIHRDAYDRDLTDVYEEMNERGWAAIYKFLENDQFVYSLFRVEQDFEPIAFYHWLFNKKTGNSVLQKLLPNDPLYEMIEGAKGLTANNELVFMAHTYLLKDCTDPFFNSVYINRDALSEESNPIIVSLKIKDF